MKAILAILTFATAVFGENPFESHPMNPIQLNHIYLVVDKATYEIIKNSDLIHSLVSTYEQKSSADNQTPWEGFYLRGKNTYIEIFYPQERYPEIGISGIGMGVDTQGALNEISEELKKELPEIKKGLFSRAGKPWFSYLAVNGSYFAGKNSFWIMEYASEYFSENSEDVSREHYNAKKYDPKKTFLNLEGFSIALNPEGFAILSSYLKGCGLRANADTYSTSENVKIQLTDENERYKGIYQIQFSMNEPQEEASYYLGNSLLTLEGKKGVWTFFANSDAMQSER